jgi:hypothetical protein
MSSTKSQKPETVANHDNEASDVEVEADKDEKNLLTYGYNWKTPVYASSLMDKVIVLNSTWNNTISKENEFSLELKKNFGDKMTNFISLLCDFFRDTYPYENARLSSENSVLFKRIFQDNFKIEARFRGSSDAIGKAQCVTIVESILRQLRSSFSQLQRNKVQSLYSCDITEMIREILDFVGPLKDGERTRTVKDKDGEPYEEVFKYRYETFVEELDASFGKAAMTGKKASAVRKEEQKKKADETQKKEEDKKEREVKKGWKTAGNKKDQQQQQQQSSNKKR